MSLRTSPLLYVFYETTSLPHQRTFCEEILGLRVIENQFYPPHEYHGLVKYDGGETILSLNLSKERLFRKDASDGLVTVLSVDSEEAIWERLRAHGYTPPDEPGSLFTDTYGHHYLFRTAASAGAPANRARPAVEELHLIVDDFATGLAFYGDVLGLTLLEKNADTARFATGGIDLVLKHSAVAPDGRPIRHHSYLLVFHTPDIVAARDALVERGISRPPRVGSSDIGLSARFIDPAGHVYCLYEPSEESLTWESGPKVRQIIGDAPTRALTLAHGD